MNSWNIFARELQTLLRRRGLQLNQLEARVGIEHEKVERLIKSLRNPKSLPVLSPSEMDLLTRALQFSEDDLIPLRAAALAATIQQTLLDHLSPEYAQQAAQQIFPLICQSLEEEAEDALGLGTTRGGPDTYASDDSDADDIFTMVTVVDQAEQLVLLSSNLSRSKKREQLQLANALLEKAQRSLNDIPRNIRNGKEWVYWQQRVQQNIVYIQKLLKAL